MLNETPQPATPNPQPTPTIAPRSVAYYELDRSAWPVVTVTFDDPPTDDAFEDYLSDLEALYDEEEPFALIFDARTASYLPSRYRQWQADWISDNEAMIEQYLAGTAYVIPTAVLRGVLRAVFALQDQPSPYTIVGSMDEARSWVEEQLNN